MDVGWLSFKQPANIPPDGSTSLDCCSRMCIWGEKTPTLKPICLSVMAQSPFCVCVGVGGGGRERRLNFIYPLAKFPCIYLQSHCCTLGPELCCTTETVFSDPHLSVPTPAPVNHHSTLSVSLTILGHDHKWDHAAFVFPCLACFT